MLAWVNRGDELMIIGEEGEGEEEGRAVRTQALRSQVFV